MSARQATIPQPQVTGLRPLSEHHRDKGSVTDRLGAVPWPEDDPGKTLSIAVPTSSHHRSMRKALAMAAPIVNPNPITIEFQSDNLTAWTPWDETKPCFVLPISSSSRVSIRHCPNPH